MIKEILTLTALAAFTLTNAAFAGTTVNSSKSIPIYTNEAFIRGLRDQSLRIDKPQEVFAFVLSRIGPEVSVFPSENYYYFKFPAAGRIFSGAIHLTPGKRDSGIVSFSYHEEVVEDSAAVFSNYKMLYAIKEFQEFGHKDGVLVKKLHDLAYSVSYGKTKVVFHLDPDPGTSSLPVLEASEELAGRSFDESGLAFFLVFEKENSTFYWILDETGYVPEHFTPLTSDTLIGVRTKYVFYQDPAANRKMLVAVEKTEVQRNSWYDGPFDQLPDNAIVLGRIRGLKSKIESAGLAEPSEGVTDGRIDELGQYIDTLQKPLQISVSISPYVQYRLSHLREDLKFIENCKERTPKDHLAIRRCLAVAYDQ